MNDYKLTGTIIINGVEGHAESVSVTVTTQNSEASYRGGLQTFPVQHSVDVKATVPELVVLTKDKYEKLLEEPAQLKREIERLENKLYFAGESIRNALDIIDES